MTGVAALSPSPAGVPQGARTPWLDELCLAGSDFHRRGWSLGTSSNYSVVASRDPLELWVTVSGRDKGRLTPEDFVRVGADGRPVDPLGPRSSAETMLHVALAELPGVGAVLHTHSVAATLLSDHFGATGRVRLSGYEMLKGLEGLTTHDTHVDVAVFENTQDIATLAGELRGRLAAGDPALSHAFLMRRHGLYTWGADPLAARRHIEVLEFLLECELRRLSLAPR